ncbi:MAG: hypothetical protein VSS75_027215 [Candidatus Parabeggiatoa sp.]|nr:hypothetical protein [Candidatus Parabeggiatoa sp.]
MSLEASLETLKVLFKDKPDALTVFDLKSITSEYLKSKIREEKLFASPINLWVTGRTGAGKTSLGNSLLDSKIMKSTGYIDCTDFIGFFRLGENLHYYDVPGYASDGSYENINRVGLLMPQIENEDADPPAVKMQDTDTFLVKDFSNCTSPKDKPETKTVNIGHWQSPEQQKDVAPDVIIYVNAPHMQFLQPDTTYLRQILQTWKARKTPCLVIPALNLFEKDGKSLSTPENLEDAKTKIAKTYQKVYGDEWYPPVIEINSLKATGIEQLTDIICQILPQDKIGNMQQVLKDDLKQHAEKEHINRYYRTLSLIAGRLARYTSDKKLDGQPLYQAAASAISSYGVMTFKGADAVADIKAQLNSIAEQVEQVEKSRQEDITQTENVMGEKNITRIVPKTEDVKIEYEESHIEMRKEKVDETIWVPEAVKEEQKTQHFVEVEKTRTRERGKFSLARLFGSTTYEEDYIDHETRTLTHDEMVIKQVEKTVSRDQFVPEVVKEQKTKTENRIVGYEEEVIDTVKIVVAQVEKVVGTKHLKGGYPVIEFLIELGLGVEDFCESSSPDWSISMQRGKLLAEQKLQKLKSKIEHLVNNPNGETELVQLLEKTLVN